MSISSYTKTTLQKVMNKPPVTVICFEIQSLIIVAVAIHDDEWLETFLFMLRIVSV